MDNETDNKKSTPNQDPRMAAMVHVIVRQGDFIVLLIAALIVSLFITVTDFKLPNQSPLTIPPPLEPSSVQFVQFVFQGNKLLDTGEKTSKSDVEILGQIMDFNKVKENWPDCALLINGQSVIPQTQNGTYKMIIKLKPGPNVIDSMIRIEGKDYSRMQTVINYEPTSTE